MGDVVWILLGGLLVGGVARVLGPKAGSLGCLGTIAIGLVGGVVGGFLGREFVGGDVNRPLIGFLFSVLGAVLVLLVIGAIRGRRSP